MFQSTFRVASRTALLAAVLLIGAGCNYNKPVAEDESMCKEVKPGTITTVNSMCVVVNDDPVNPEVTPAVWKGQKVGFCCDGCKPRWEKMTDSQKDAALATAIATPAPK